MRVRVGVIFGGESVEHEISIISAMQAIAAMDENKYEVVPLYISKQNRWYTGKALTNIETFKDLDAAIANAQQVLLQTEHGHHYVYAFPFKMLKNKPLAEIDVAFPVVHGTNVEDGILQGYLDALRIPYVGPTVGAAAVGQDKVFMKNIWQANGLPVVPFVWLYSNQWEQQPERFVHRIEATLHFPVIVKPANLGSSVGISIAKDTEGLIEAINEAAQYDDKIIVEQVVDNLLEVNCSVLGDFTHAVASPIEEVMGSDEILSYRDKYQGGNGKGGSKADGGKLAPLKTSGAKTADGGSKGAGMAATNRIIPARISEEATKEIQRLARQAFYTLNMSGVSRIDFLIDKEEGNVYLNEINTIPGSLSFYLWQESGIDFTELTDRLIQFAIKAKQRRERKVFSYDSNVLANAKLPAQGAKSGVKQ